MGILLDDRYCDQCYAFEFTKDNKKFIIEYAHCEFDRYPCHVIAVRIIACSNSSLPDSFRLVMNYGKAMKIDRVIYPNLIYMFLVAHRAHLSEVGEGPITAPVCDHKKMIYSYQDHFRYPSFSKQ